MARFLPAAQATSCTAPNFGCRIRNFPDLPRFLSPSPGKTSNQSSFQLVPPAIPTSLLRNPDLGGRPGGETRPRLTRAGRPSPRSNFHRCPRLLWARLPPHVHPQPKVSKWGCAAAAGGSPESLGTLEKPVSLGPGRFRK